MRTIKSVIKERPEYKVLINAVVGRIGKEYIEDVNRHGMAGGFCGFTYYADTHKFAMRYRKYIIELLEESYQAIGYASVIDMVSSFGVFRNSPMDADDRKDLYRYLGGGRPEQCVITNVMAWFAAEEVCRWFEE